MAGSVSPWWMWWEPRVISSGSFLSQNVPEGKTAASLPLSLHLPTWIPPSHLAPLSLGISPPDFPASCSDPQKG